MKSTNTKKIKPEKMKQLQEIEAELKEMLTLIQSVISGDITQGEMAKALGYTENHCSQLISEHLSPYFTRRKLFTPDEMLETLEDLASPYEKIVKAIFFGTKNKCPKNKLFVMNHMEEKVIADAIEATLSDREKEILSLRYGLCEQYPNGLSFGKIAVLQNCTSESVRQLDEKALRKLRTPELYYDLFPEYKECITTLQDIGEIITAGNFICKERKAIYDLCNSVKNHMILLQMDDEAKQLTDKYQIKTSNEDLENINIKYLHLSARPYNALKRYGCDTIHDVTSLTKKELSQIRGLGKTSQKEIIDALAVYGLSLRK